MKNKEDILAKWLSGEITDAELVASEGEAALQELKQVKDEVDQWSMPKYNTDAGYQKLKDRMEAKTPGNSTAKWIKVIGLAAVFGFLAFGLYSLFNNQPEELKAPNGETINYAFQDGSEVWLNDGSNVTFNTDEWSDIRTIQLEGEALFEVKKGSPFTVQTQHGTVTVLGTQFNVRAWGDNLFVECYEGKVQVQSEDQITIITANEGVSVIAGEMQSNQEINITSPSWKNGISRFYNDQLSVVFDELERQYQVNIQLNVEDRTFSGTFKHDDLDQALRSICKPLGLNSTISQDRKSVVIE